MEQESILDFAENQFTEATATQRFFTYIIDSVILLTAYMGSLFLGVFSEHEIENSIMPNFLFISILLAYYSLFEGIWGKSIGKMVTGTLVLDLEGNKISVNKAFLRALCRLIPFEAFSAFIRGGMWHDRFTSTQVVKAR